jgi:hypothetical protein
LPRRVATGNWTNEETGRSDRAVSMSARAAPSEAAKTVVSPSAQAAPVRLRRFESDPASLVTRSMNSSSMQLDGLSTSRQHSSRLNSLSGTRPSTVHGRLRGQDSATLSSNRAAQEESSECERRPLSYSRISSSSALAASSDPEAVTTAHAASSKPLSSLSLLPSAASHAAVSSGASALPAVSSLSPETIRSGIARSDALSPTDMDLSDVSSDELPTAAVDPVTTG